LKVAMQSTWPSVAAPEPHHVRHPEVGAEGLLDAGPIQLRIPVRCQQALLGGDEARPLVDEDRAALEHDRRVEGHVAVALGEDAAGGLVAVPADELLPPRVEPEVDTGPSTIRVEREDRPAVAQPRVIDRQLDQVDTGGQ